LRFGRLGKLGLDLRINLRNFGTDNIGRQELGKMA